MGFIAVKCPNCGGELKLDDSLTSGYCMYCGAKVLNETAVVGKVSIDRSSELKNRLKVLCALIDAGDVCNLDAKIEDALNIDAGCADAWYMKAYCADLEGNFDAVPKYLSNGDSGSSYGLFLREKVKRSHEFGACLDRARTSIVKADVRGAEQAITEMEAIDPDCSEIMYTKAFLAREANDGRACKEYLSKGEGLTVHDPDFRDLVLAHLKYNVCFWIEFGMLCPWKYVDLKYDGKVLTCTKSAHAPPFVVRGVLPGRRKFKFVFRDRADNHQKSEYVADVSDRDLDIRITITPVIGNPSFSEIER